VPDAAWRALHCYKNRASHPHTFSSHQPRGTPYVRAHRCPGRVSSSLAKVGVTSFLPHPRPRRLTASFPSAARSAMWGSSGDAGLLEACLGWRVHDDMCRCHDGSAMPSLNTTSPASPCRFGNPRWPGMAEGWSGWECTNVLRVPMRNMPHRQAVPCARGAGGSVEQGEKVTGNAWPQSRKRRFAMVVLFGPFF
jgi:hypothetical protein